MLSGDVPADTVASDAVVADVGAGPAEQPLAETTEHIEDHDALWVMWTILVSRGATLVLVVESQVARSRPLARSSDRRPS